MSESCKHRRHIKSTLLKCALISYVAYNDVGSNNNLIFVYYPFFVRYQQTTLYDEGSPNNIQDTNWRKWGNSLFFFSQ